MDALTAEADVRAWVDRVVVGMGLCPFARAALPGTRIAAVGDGDSALGAILDEAARLDRADQPATTLLVVPHGLDDFADYLAALAEAEAVLSASGYDGIIQIASFHPDYQFDGADADDPANWTNRSPWPLFHLLRERDVTAAVDQHPDPGGIPLRNQRLLRGLGDAVRALSRRG